MITCRLKKTLVFQWPPNQRWISTASTDFIFPSAPRPGFRRDERLRRGYRPSAGLRLLNVSRVKCGGLTLSLPLSATMYETYDMPTIRLYERIAEGLISTCRKYVVAATRFPSPLRLETISARNGPCPVPRNLSLPSPAKPCRGK